MTEKSSQVLIRARVELAHLRSEFPWTTQRRLKTTSWPKASASNSSAWTPGDSSHRLYCRWCDGDYTSGATCSAGCADSRSVGSINVPQTFCVGASGLVQAERGAWSPSSLHVDLTAIGCSLLSRSIADIGQRRLRPYTPFCRSGIAASWPRSLHCGPKAPAGILAFRGHGKGRCG
jgi:hypothetical protein